MAHNPAYLIPDTMFNSLCFNVFILISVAFKLSDIGLQLLKMNSRGVGQSKKTYYL